MNHEIVELMRDRAAEYGLNLIGAIPATAYAATGEPAESRMRAAGPHARSIIVIGNGGGALWRALKTHANTHPGWLDRDHPLDDFTREVVEQMLLPPLRERKFEVTTAYPGDPDPFNFMLLARLAGLGGPSIIGVMVHPVYGPWIALRAALLIDLELDSSGAAAGFDPCPRCTVRSCIPACPVDAVSAAGGWNVPRCIQHRVESEADCAARCHARVGCVLGPEHRYPDDELAYHQRRTLPAMRAYYDAHLSKPRSDR